MRKKLSRRSDQVDGLWFNPIVRERVYLRSQYLHSGLCQRFSEIHKTGLVHAELMQPWNYDHCWRILNAARNVKAGARQSRGRVEGEGLNLIGGLIEASDPIFLLRHAREQRHGANVLAGRWPE